jgi:SAM-dependent methyltransferase
MAAPNAERAEVPDGKSHDSRYYAHGASIGINTRLSHRARIKNYRHFAGAMRPGPDTTILDVGTCDEITVEANMLQQLHPHLGQITCTSIGPGDAILAAYPGVSHARITAGAPLPFADAEFDIAFSNAVLEHVGGAARQRAFVAEMCRVARRIYIAVPNRLFPVEHHTAIPLLHWLPKPWFRAILRCTRFRFYGQEQNLNHVSASQLCSWFPAHRPARIARTGVGVGPFRSNLVAFEE